MHRSIVVTVTAIAVTISAGTVIIGMSMRGPTHVAVAEWPVSLPPVRGTPPSAPAIAPEPEPVPASAAAAPPPAIVARAPARAVTSSPVRVEAAATPPPAAAVPADPSAPGPATATSDTGDVSAILSVLDRYRRAFSSLDVRSVRAVWPAADAHALAREFGELKRQMFAIDNCDIDVQGAQAEAVCGGRVSRVTKTGAAAPNVSSRRWVFTLLQQQDRWRIHTVDSH